MSLFVRCTFTPVCSVQTMLALVRILPAAPTLTVILLLPVTSLTLIWSLLIEGAVPANAAGMVASRFLCL